MDRCMEEKCTTGSGMIYTIDDKPPVMRSLFLGLQHYLTMFGSTVAIPLILSGPLGITDPMDKAKLIATMFFVSGITTLLQSTFGNRLPIVQGGTFSFLAPTIAICGSATLAGAGWQVKMQHVQGAIIIGAIVEIILGYSGLIGKLKKKIGPITIAPTIALIGLALYQYGAPKAGADWLVGGLTIVLIILFSQYLRHVNCYFEMFPILIAIVLAWMFTLIGSNVGWFPAGHPSHVDLKAIGDAAWFRIPYPFQWGWPVFKFSAVVGMLSGYLASMIESVGDYYACARLSGAPNPDEKVINRGIGMEGVGCLIAGIIGTGNGTTSYSENIGAIGLTRVASRRVVQYGALLMIVFGAIAKFGAIFTTIPDPIVGGMYCALFGMIAAVGISNLQFVDLNSPRNLFIIGFSFFMGLSVPVYFAANPLVLASIPWLADIINTIGNTGMAVGGILAFILDNTIPGTDEERGLIEWLKTT
ncbi:MAG: solute carrier family 23 protein [bacterium]|nr:solute carrier family 23 protein [bacterium]